MSAYSSVILADSPQAYYRLDEASGLVAHDLTGHGYNGTLSHVTSYSQAGAISTESDTSLLFAAADTLSLPYTLNPSTWTALSVEMWIQLTGGWQQVVVTADGSGGSLYLNGALYTSGSGDIVDIDQSLSFIGNLTQSGDMDEVSIYDYQLSTLQVRSHYEGHPLLPPPVPAGPENSPYIGGVVGRATLPIKQVSSSYAVDGIPLSDTPYLATSPAPLSGSTILYPGTPFTLFFQSPSAGTQTALANGMSVTLTFGLAQGFHATGQVQVNSSLSGSIFLVHCTLLHPVYL